MVINGERKNILYCLNQNLETENKRQSIPLYQLLKCKLVTRFNLQTKFLNFRKPKNSLLYKNPYLGDGSPQPSNILKPPHIASLQGPTDSPWKIKLANLCDSDTASEDSDLCRRKLNFDDDDSEKENKRQPKLNTDKRKNETNSPSLQRLLDKIQNEPARNFNSVAETKKTPSNLNCLDAKPKKASETAGTGKIKSQRKKDKQVAASGCSDTEEVEKRLEDLSLKDMRSSYLKNKEVTYSFLASLSGKHFKHLSNYYIRIAEPVVQRKLLRYV